MLNFKKIITFLIIVSLFLVQEFVNTNPHAFAESEILLKKESNDQKLPLSTFIQVKKEENNLIFETKINYNHPLKSEVKIKNNPNILIYKADSTEEIVYLSDKNKQERIYLLSEGDTVDNKEKLSLKPGEYFVEVNLDLNINNLSNIENLADTYKIRNMTKFKLKIESKNDDGKRKIDLNQHKNSMNLNNDRSYSIHEIEENPEMSSLMVPYRLYIRKNLEIGDYMPKAYIKENNGYFLLKKKNGQDVKYMITKQNNNWTLTDSK